MACKRITEDITRITEIQHTAQGPAPSRVLPHHPRIFIVPQSYPIRYWFGLCPSLWSEGGTTGILTKNVIKPYPNIRIELSSNAILRIPSQSIARRIRKRIEKESLYGKGNVGRGDKAGAVQHIGIKAVVARLTDG